jgi:hypothetical protein
LIALRSSWRAFCPLADGFPNPLFDQLYLHKVGRLLRRWRQLHPGGIQEDPAQLLVFPMPVSAKISMPQLVEYLLKFLGMILDMFGLAVKTIVEIRFRAGIVVVLKRNN